ncbi:MAG TPA: four helix bundle protein [Patescibacteria group bacterium]|nr:four helix bundle protein [Patescibacteria group bacterium]
MDIEKEKIKNFTDLRTWQEAHKLVLMIYNATKDFPKDEMYGLTSQIRRAAVSISSNIAEGFTRYSYKEKIQFYYIASGSVTEVQNQIIAGKDIGYLNQEVFTNLYSKSIDVHKLLNSLIRGSRNHS